MSWSENCGEEFGEFLEIRGEYIERLREEGLIYEYDEDSPLYEHYQQYPEDPLHERLERSPGIVDITNSDSLRDRLCKSENPPEWCKYTRSGAEIENSLEEIYSDYLSTIEEQNLRFFEEIFPLIPEDNLPK